MDDTIKKLLIGLRVKTKEDHKYIQVSKRQIGIVTNVWHTEVTVKFKKRKRPVTFLASELKRVNE